MSTIVEAPAAASASAIAETVRSIAQSAATPEGREPLPLFHRELSWLEFNQRVLGEAENASVPLLERLKFLSICANNLDEFFMIRIGELRDLMVANVSDSGGHWSEQLESIRKRTRRLLEDMYACLGQQLMPQLLKEGVRIERVSELGKKDRVAVEEYFMRDLEPILTPLAIDPGHPFPFVANLTLNLAMILESERGDTHVAVLRVPDLTPRLFRLSDGNRYVLIEDIITFHVERLFPGLRLRRSTVFRVIRNSDISIKEEDVQDLLKSVESELRRRERREVVWMEIEAGSDEGAVALLSQSMQVGGDDIFSAPGPLKLADFMQLFAQVSDTRLKDPPFNPRIPAQLASAEDIFSIIRKSDILLHRPYDSFTAVIEFVQTAAEDADVVAIKQTLYRTDLGSPIIEALAAAAARGKQVTAVVELQARFDEKMNINWARHLEQAGVQVVYGLVGIKTHCKVCLVVRREGSELRRYLHLSTGNYNAVTARIYSDIDLFTCDPGFGADAAQLMNLLTGFSVAGVQEMIENRKALHWNHFIVAPMDYQRWTISMIDREAQHAREGKPARIVAKLNALVDAAVIEALYRASRAGVKIQLLVRGICCLVPGLKGVSENIEVMSIVDRFLEHARVFRFENGGHPEFYLSSGDWMPRNFIRRIETTFPVRSEALIKRIDEQILPISLADNVKSWTLDSEGHYRRRETTEPVVRSQESFIGVARAEAVRLGPYDEMLRRPGTFRRKAKRKKKQRTEIPPS